MEMGLEGAILGSEPDIEEGRDHAYPLRTKEIYDLDSSDLCYPSLPTFFTPPRAVMQAPNYLTTGEGQGDY